MKVNISDYVKENIDYEKINKLYLEHKIPKNQFYLLSSLKDERFLRKFLCGIGEYKLYYENVDPELYLANFDAVLDAFYSLHNAHPNLNLDKLLRDELLVISETNYEVYNVLLLISSQLRNEKNGTSPFKVINIEILKNCKRSVNQLKDALAKIKKHEGRNRENGYLDVIKDINEDLKKTIGFDIFGDDGEPKKTYQ